jgi:hypothetical protein
MRADIGLLPAAIDARSDMGPNGLPRQAGGVGTLLPGPAEITLGTMVAKDGGIDKIRAGR